MLTPEVMGLGEEQQSGSLLFQVSPLPEDAQRAAQILQGVLDGVAQELRPGFGARCSSHLQPIPRLLCQLQQTRCHFQRLLGPALLDVRVDHEMECLPLKLLVAVLLGLVQWLCQGCQRGLRAILVKESLSYLEQGGDLLLLGAHPHGFGQLIRRLTQRIRGRRALLERLRHALLGGGAAPLPLGGPGGPTLGNGQDKLVGLRP
mmetsp:Transcript_28116/g.87629  ORF Transcript_28116/g.87629 Transcript_28116/m.87629 type:complete len:204 (+) Transcript_28116:1083-1694(+)